VIGQDQPTETNAWIERRIFPGAYPPTLRELTDIFQPPCFSILDIEIDLTVVAALLTISGYSINDTIVVFDRIRENMGLLKRMSFAELIDKSVNQTLSRTILTSGVTLLTVLALFFLGGRVIHNFALALLVGFVFGSPRSSRPAPSAWTSRTGGPGGRWPGPHTLRRPPPVAKSSLRTREGEGRDRFRGRQGTRQFSGMPFPPGSLPTRVVRTSPPLHRHRSVSITGSRTRPWRRIGATHRFTWGSGCGSPPPRSSPASDGFRIGRLKYDGGGDWYSNPSSLPNLLEALKSRTPIAVTNMQEDRVELLDEELFAFPLIYMNGHGEVRFSPAEVERLREYVSRGGFLWGDVITADGPSAAKWPGIPQNPWWVALQPSDLSFFRDLGGCPRS
jgi:hypothetical protein